MTLKEYKQKRDELLARPFWKIFSKRSRQLWAEVRNYEINHLKNI